MYANILGADWWLIASLIVAIIGGNGIRGYIDSKNKKELESKRDTREKIKNLSCKRVDKAISRILYDGISFELDECKDYIFHRLKHDPQLFEKTADHLKCKDIYRDIMFILRDYNKKVSIIMESPYKDKLIKEYIDDNNRIDIFRIYQIIKTIVDYGIEIKDKRFFGFSEYYRQAKILDMNNKKQKFYHISEHEQTLDLNKELSRKFQPKQDKLESEYYTELGRYSKIDIYTLSKMGKHHIIEERLFSKINLIS